MLHAGEELERSNSLEMAQKLGIAIQYFPRPSAAEVRGACASMAADPPQAIVVFPDPVTAANRQQIIDFAGTLRIPVVSGWADLGTPVHCAPTDQNSPNPTGDLPISSIAF